MTQHIYYNNLYLYLKISTMIINLIASVHVLEKNESTKRLKRRPMP